MLCVFVLTWLDTSVTRLLTVLILVAFAFTDSVIPTIAFALVVTRLSMFLIFSAFTLIFLAFTLILLIFVVT